MSGPKLNFLHNLAQFRAQFSAETYTAAIVSIVFATQVDSTLRFFQIRGIFHYFRAFKTEILQIHSLIGQILKQICGPVNIHR